MPTHVLHDPSTNLAITRRVEATDPIRARDRSLTPAAAGQRHDPTRSSAHVHMLQRLSVRGQQQFVLHLNRTQGNRQVQRLAQTMQRSQSLASVVHHPAGYPRTVAPAALDRAADSAADLHPTPLLVQRLPGMEDVVEIPDYVPNCVDNYELARKTYRRGEGAIRGESDTDLFYRDGDGPLVPITVDMVNAFFDPRYGGFAKISGPDWRKNCEDYAKESGFGSKIGDYASAEALLPLLRNQGTYVVQLGFHWMRVQNTNGSSITIRQKDGESAVYERTYDTVEMATAYILEKRSAGGSVYAAE